VLNEVITVGIREPELREELYAQVIKQTTSNPNKSSLNKNWIVLWLYLHSFPPPDVMIPYGKKKSIFCIHQFLISLFFPVKAYVYRHTLELNEEISVMAISALKTLDHIQKIEYSLVPPIPAMLPTMIVSGTPSLLFSSSHFLSRWQQLKNLNFTKLWKK